MAAIAVNVIPGDDWDIGSAASHLSRRIVAWTYPELFSGRSAADSRLPIVSSFLTQKGGAYEKVRAPAGPGDL